MHGKIYATMRAMLRYDRAPLKAKRTPEGFLIDSPVLSRVGVFPYRQPDGKTQYEYRPAEEVFHPDHLSSVLHKPVNDEHKGRQIGASISAGRADTDNPHHLVGDIIIHDATPTLTKKELSLGYSLELEMTPGEFEGVRYDAIQRNLRVVEVALTTRGRAGVARLNLDAADAVSVSTEEENMSLVKVRLDSGLEYDVPPEVQIAIAAQSAAVKNQKDRADAAEAARDTLQAKVDGHAAAITQARADALAQVQARTRLEADATKLNVKFNADADDNAVRIAVIKSVRGDSFDPAGKSDAYIVAAFDFAVEDGVKAKANAAGNRVAAAGGARADSAATTEGSAASGRAKMIADLKNAGA